MSRLTNAWNALMGRPVCDSLPPVKLLEIKPEDKLLLECENSLSAEQANYLNNYITSWLNGEKSVAVLRGGIRIVAVLRQPVLLKGNKNVVATD